MSWSTGICGCMEDVTSCLDHICCGPCMISRTCSAAEGQSDQCTCMNCLLASCFGICTLCALRRKIVDKYTIDEGTIGTCLCTLFCAECSGCQMHREMTVRGTWPGGSCCHKQPGNFKSIA